jgi:hypothetical protein
MLLLKGREVARGLQYAAVDTEMKMLVRHSAIEKCDGILRKRLKRREGNARDPENETKCGHILNAHRSYNVGVQNSSFPEPHLTK